VCKFNKIGKTSTNKYKQVESSNGRGCTDSAKLLSDFFCHEVLTCFEGKTSCFSFFIFKTSDSKGLRARQNKSKEVQNKYQQNGVVWGVLVCTNPPTAPSRAR